MLNWQDITVWGVPKVVIAITCEFPFHPTQFKYCAIKPATRSPLTLGSRHEISITEPGLRYARDAASASSLGLGPPCMVLDHRGAGAAWLQDQHARQCVLSFPIMTGPDGTAAIHVRPDSPKSHLTAFTMPPRETRQLAESR